MADGSVTDAQANLWLTDISSTGWVSLHYDNPNLGGPGKHEISGAGYTRYNPGWTQPNNRTTWTNDDCRWSGLAQNKLTYFGVWDQRRNGTLMAYGELPDPVSIPDGGGYVLHKKMIVISFG